MQLQHLLCCDLLAAPGSRVVVTAAYDHGKRLERLDDDKHNVKMQKKMLMLMLMMMMTMMRVMITMMSTLLTVKMMRMVI